MTVPRMGKKLTNNESSKYLCFNKTTENHANFQGVGMVGVSWNSEYWRQIRKYPLPNCLISLLYLHLLRGAVGWGGGGGVLGGRQNSGHNVSYSLPCHLWHLSYRGAAPFSSLPVEDWPGLVFSLWLPQFLGSEEKQKIDWLFLFLCRINKYSSHVTAEKKERADPETAVGVLSFHKNSQIVLIMSVNCEHN